MVMSRVESRGSTRWGREPFFSISLLQNCRFSNILLSTTPELESVVPAQFDPRTRVRVRTALVEERASVPFAGPVPSQSSAYMFIYHAITIKVLNQRKGRQNPVLRLQDPGRLCSRF